MLSINVPSIYKLSTQAPAPGGGGRAGGPAAVAQGRTVYEQKCESCHGVELKGNGTFPSLVDITSRMGPEPLREVIIGGRPGMPPNNDLSQADLEALVAFLGNPTPVGAGEAPDLERRRRRLGVQSSPQAARRAGAWFRRGEPAAWSGRRIRRVSRCRRCACTPATAWTARS